MLSAAHLKAEISYPEAKGKQISGINLKKKLKQKRQRRLFRETKIYFLSEMVKEKTNKTKPYTKASKNRQILGVNIKNIKGQDSTAVFF